MRRLILIALAGLLLTTPALAVNRLFLITSKTIGYAGLHWQQHTYRNLWGKPVRLDRLENGYSRLHFSKRHVEVYFKVGQIGGVAVLTWNRRDRTSKAIGPCSTVAAFKRAYPNAVAFKQGGKVVAYRLGRLLFTAEGARIGVVMLATSAVSPFVALNAPECS